MIPSSLTSRTILHFFRDIPTFCLIISEMKDVIQSRYLRILFFRVSLNINVTLTTELFAFQIVSNCPQVKKFLFFSFVLKDMTFRKKYFTLQKQTRLYWSGAIRISWLCQQIKLMHYVGAAYCRAYSIALNDRWK